MKNITKFCLCAFLCITGLSLHGAVAMFELWNRLDESKLYKDHAKVIILRAAGTASDPLQVGQAELIRNGAVCAVGGLVTQTVIIVQTDYDLKTKKPGVYPDKGIAHAFYYVFPATRLVYLELGASGKNIYVKPQTGWFSTAKSKGGYPLTNNVKAKEIKTFPIDYPEVKAALNKKVDFIWQKK